MILLVVEASDVREYNNVDVGDSKYRNTKDANTKVV
jgi:hypothetical protein